METVVFWSEQAKGYVRVELDDNGLIKLIYHIDTPKAKQYSGFRLILKDLLNVKEVITTLRPEQFNGVSSIIKQSLSFYAIITYGKCFAEAKGRGTQLNKTDALKYATKEQLEEHDRIIDQRNNYVAHGGLKGYEHNPVVVSLDRDKMNKGQFEIYDNLMGLVDIDSQLNNFEGLVDAVIKYVREKCISLLEKIKKEVTDTNLVDMYTNAIDPSKLELVSIKVDKK